MVKKKDFIWNAIGLTANCFNSLFFLIIVNRINGINKAGIFTYSFSICCLFYFISLFYNRTYQVSENKHKLSFNDFLSVRVVFSILSIILLLIFTIISKFDLFKISTIMLIMLFRTLEAISDVFYGEIQKKDKLYYVGISLTIKAIVGVILFGIIDYLTKNILLAIISLIIVNLLVLLIGDLFVFKKINNTKLKFTLKRKDILIKETFSIFIFSFLSIFLINCQKYIMEYFVDNKFQTIFGIIVMPATVLSLVGTYLITPFVNKLTELKNNGDYKEFNKIYYIINLALFIFGIVALIVCYLLGIPVLNIVYSINLNKYKLSLLIIVFSSIFYASTMISSGCLTILEKNIQQLYIYIGSVLIGLLLSIVLIKYNGIEGAVLSYAISMIIHFVLYTILYLIEKRKIEKTNKR